MVSLGTADIKVRMDISEKMVLHLTQIFFTLTSTSSLHIG